MAATKKDDPGLIPAEDVVFGDERSRVPFAGLLAHEPELRDTELTHEQWAEKLDRYLFPGPDEPVDADAASEDDQNA